MKRKKYAVVQDHRPFGFRVESTHRTLVQARLAARYSKYLKVETVEWVEAENKRLEDINAFYETLEASLILDQKLPNWRNRSQSSAKR